MYAMQHVGMQVHSAGSSSKTASPHRAHKSTIISRDTAFQAALGSALKLLATLLSGQIVHASMKQYSILPERMHMKFVVSNWVVQEISMSESCLPLGHVLPLGRSLSCGHHNYPRTWENMYCECAEATSSHTSNLKFTPAQLAFLLRDQKQA